MGPTGFALPIAQAPAPRMGLGLAALGRPAYLNVGHGDDLGHHPSPETLQRRAHAVLDAAWRAGIRYLDAARSYGLAEQFLGSWLQERGIATESIVVGSKWGYRYTAAWDRDAEVHEVKDHRAAMLDAQWEETVAALGRAPDLYQIHSATMESGVLEDRAVLRRLGDLAADGLLVGLSVSGPDQATVIRRAVELTRSGDAPFASVQATWNLLEPSAGSALSEAAAAGMTVIVKEALANGRLTSREPIAAARLGEAMPGPPPDAVALAAALQQPWSSIVLSGAATVDQLASNLEALGITTDVVAAVGPMAETADEYWRHRSAMVWT